MPPTVQAVATNNMVVGVQGMSVVLRFEILQAHPSVDTNDIMWTFNENLTLNSLSDVYGAELSFSNDYLTLTINNLGCSNKGEYKVLASNSIGNSEDYIQLIVDGEFKKGIW